MQLGSYQGACEWRVIVQIDTWAQKLSGTVMYCNVCIGIRLLNKYYNIQHNCSNTVVYHIWLSLLHKWTCSIYVHTIQTQCLSSNIVLPYLRLVYAWTSTGYEPW